MQISPKLSIALNVLYALLAVLTVQAVKDAGFAQHAEQISAWVSFLAAPLNVFLHSVSSSDSGPLVK